MNINDRSKSKIKRAYDLGGFVLILKELDELNLSLEEKVSLRNFINDTFLHNKFSVAEFEKAVGI